MGIKASYCKKDPRAKTMFISFYIIAYLTLVQCDKDIKKLAKKLGLRRPNGKGYHDICKISCKYARPEKGAKMRLVVKYVNCLNNCEAIKKDCKISGRKGKKNRDPKKLRTYVNSCVKKAMAGMDPGRVAPTNKP